MYLNNAVLHIRAPTPSGPSIVATVSTTLVAPAHSCTPLLGTCLLCTQAHGPLPPNPVLPHTAAALLLPAVLAWGGCQSA